MALKSVLRARQLNSIYFYVKDIFLSVLVSLCLLFIFLLWKFIATASYSLILWGRREGVQGSEQGQMMNILKISVMNF